MKQEIETQRLKLLRLVTGWLVLLGVLSAGPLALPLPRWVRAFFEAVVIRAECAAQYVVQASALMQAVGGVAPTAGLMPRTACEEEDDVPTARDLIRRMEALRDVLENLPRYARRLLKVRTVAGEAFDWSMPFHPTETRSRLTTGGADRALRRIESPPDKLESLFLSTSFNLPPAFGAGGAWVC